MFSYDREWLTAKLKVEKNENGEEEYTPVSYLKIDLRKIFLIIGVMLEL